MRKASKFLETYFRKHSIIKIEKTSALSTTNWTVEIQLCFKKRQLWNRWQWSDVAFNSLNFKDPRHKICVPLAMSIIFKNSMDRCFLLLTWATFFFHAALGSIVESMASICLHRRPLRACAEPNRALARRGEAPLAYIYIYMNICIDMLAMSQQSRSQI